ncbi:MAG: hypothetical protein ACRCVW_03780 [Brevinema sp.]
MKKKLGMMFLFMFPIIIYSKENNIDNPITYGGVPRLEFGITGLSVNIYFGALDIDFAWILYQKGIHSLAFKTTLFTYVPRNIDFPQAPYVLMGGLFEIQYRLSTRKGFFYAFETGVGVGNEMITTQIYDAQIKQFLDSPIMATYGLFSVGTRFGYDFEPKYGKPFKIAIMFGYRMQYPFNFTIKHFLVGGISFNYAFDLYGGKK